MAEREPVPLPALDEKAVAKALHTLPATVRDVAYGEGHQFSAGRGAVRLEIFPRTGVTRVTTRDTRIELFGSAVSALTGSGVEFALDHPREEASLTVLSDSGVVFTFIAGGESVTDTSRQRAAVLQTDEHTPGGTPAPADLGSREDTSPASAVDGNGAGERPTGQQDVPVNHEAEERVRVSGRLGRDPSFYTTRSGKRVAKFPLAVPQAEGQTSWHDVVAFDERADELKERAGAGQLGRGNAVDVVGYWHENQKPGKDGTARTVRDLYAVAVQKQTARNGA